jgi:Ca2+-binding EF-hand superfamily protein
MTSKNTRRILSLTLAAFSLIALPAAAHEGHGKAKGAGYERLLKRADKNADGKLQVSELPGRLAKRLGSADANKDGVIAKEELAARREEAKKEHLARFQANADANKDGKVSPEERTAARKERAKGRFTRMDKNGDGQIGKGDVGDERWKRLSAADADKNGSVSFAEMEQAFSAGKTKRRAR